MRGYIFLLESLLAVTITLIAIGLIDINYSPKSSLEMHRQAQDSLAILKATGRLQSFNQTAIEEILNVTTNHYRLEIYEYNKADVLQSVNVIGEQLENDATISKCMWVTDNRFYLVNLGVWN